MKSDDSEIACIRLTFLKKVIINFEQISTQKPMCFKALKHNLKQTEAADIQAEGTLQFPPCKTHAAQAKVLYNRLEESEGGVWAPRAVGS